MSYIAIDIIAFCPLCKKERIVKSHRKKNIVRKCRKCNKKNPNYRNISANGYVVVTDVIKNIYVYEHRYEWEKVHGEIPPGFIIHHIDRNRQNNKIENLQQMSKKEHDIISLNENVINKTRRSFKTANQKDFDKELLVDMISQKLSLREIGRRLNCSHTTIRRNMRDYGITL